MKNELCVSINLHGLGFRMRSNTDNVRNLKSDGNERIDERKREGEKKRERREERRWIKEGI